ncbi:ATP-binding protein [Aquincola tertiaricarbonis]|uniref:histidine kinase n=1 Tax=Aquincola tertiaricarbonis TaxID=391953 RepID=A0ABY4SHH2_AQUTE|nr:ATP-binding protein [Aquincola tertiaricarbonis]URI11582.1 ATP-binding protein [Aquincola tertiaricarbonis]
MSADPAVVDPGASDPGTATLAGPPCTALHKLPAAVFVLHQAEDGRFSFPFASEALQRIFMIPAARLAADAAVVAGSIPADDLALLKRQLAQALELGQTCHCRLRICPPGVKEAWYELVAAPELLPAGGALWHGLLTDVTHQQRRQEELRLQQRRWRQAARVADLGLVEYDPVSARLRLDAVASRHHGLLATPAWLALADWLALLAPDDRLLGHAALNSTPVPGATERLHLRLPLPDGSQRTLELMLQQAEDEDRLVGTCRVAEPARQPATAHPVPTVPRDAPATDAGASNDAAPDAGTEATRLPPHQREFLSRISHELRTPLNGVLGFAQLMAQDRNAPLPPAQQQRLEVIRQSGARLMGLIDQLLDVRGLEEGRTLLRPAPLDLREPLRRCLDRLTPLARERQVQVAADVPADTPPLLADGDALARVLENLLSNAIQYNRPGGHVHLHLTLRGRQAILAVEDTGRGMSAQQLSRLFDPLQRVEAPGQPAQGSGLGLVIARQLVQAMDGRIRVQSKPGVGTRVELQLPLAERRAATPPPQPPADPRQRILYIEDDPVNTLLMQHLIEGQPGWRLITAATGAQGLALAHSERPAVILLDLHLPDISGQQVLQALRSDPATRDIPCVAVSADARTEPLAMPGSGGFDASWNKPIDVDQVLGGLRSLLAASRAPRLQGHG